jgi:hypothetical protein
MYIYVLHIVNFTILYASICKILPFQVNKESMKYMHSLAYVDGWNAFLLPSPSP